MFIIFLFGRLISLIISSWLSIVTPRIIFRLFTGWLLVVRLEWSVNFLFFLLFRLRQILNNRVHGVLVSFLNSVWVVFQCHCFTPAENNPPS
jgi:hypothetical protein